MYSELHTHSCFSLLDGASTPGQLVESASALGYRALALTDHNEMGGAVQFAEAAREEGLAAILGTELTVIWDGELTHLTLLAESREGYGNLCQLITQSRMELPRGEPAVTPELLGDHARGIFALSGCLRGRVPALVARGNEAAARTAAAQLREMFDGRLAIECWDHSLEEERVVVPALQRIAHYLGVPWVVTNDVHYAHPDEWRTHDVLTALRHQRTLEEMGSRLRPSGEWYLKHPAQHARRWQHDTAGLHASVEIGERCAFRLEQLKPAMPDFPLPPGVTADEYLARLVAQGARERWGRDITLAQRRQLTHELDLIKRLDFAGYFLIVWDIVRFARREGILCQGRGSAANSAVCYCLGITAIDPVAMELLFERFLSEDRREAPDIDLDFAHQERERVIQYVYQRYGRAHAAMVCEQITWRERSAIRDAARVLGYSAEEGDAMAELGHETRDAGRETRDPRPATTDDRRPSTVDHIAHSLHNLPRHRSIHVGGFVLTREPLATVVPIEPASMPDRTVIQWEKDDLDPVGLVKIDLLGLGMLTALQECLHTIRRTRGVSLDLATIPHGDMAVYDDLCRADTVGVFQVESRAQMNTLPRLKPRCFYDLVVEVALIRPGPIQGDMVHPYLRRRAGTEAVTYPHPALEPILKRTLGVPLFQEQGMQVAITAAGFTPGEADTLRRAMGHKRSRERMAAICAKLITGMKRNGIPEETAQQIFNQINAFADYGFPESHAASFAILVYASAYLRHYYAPEYLAAMLNAQPMGFYSPGTLVEDARRHGVEVRGVDLTRSAWDCTMEAGRNGPVVRLGLRTVRGLGARAREILEAGAATRAYRNVSDVVHAGLDRRTLRALAEAGAFDGMFPGAPARRRRRTALWAVLAAERGDAGPLAPPVAAATSPPLPAMTPVELTEADYRMTGLSLAGHPMSHLREWLRRNGVPTAAEILRDAGRGTRDAGYVESRGSSVESRVSSPASVVVAGLVICRQRPHTAHGFVFVTLEDETGMLNVVIPPTVFEKQRLLIARTPLLMVRGELQVEGLVVNIKAVECQAIQAEVGRHARSHDFH
jgi:error-prone DNA polymerase